MDTIGVDQSVSNSALYEHRCLWNIKRIYKYSDKRDYHQQYKPILEAEKVSTPEELTKKFQYQLINMSLLKTQVI